MLDSISSAIFGGARLGLAASWLLVTIGRVAGICRLSRLSKRSLAATLTLMVIGPVTASLVGLLSVPLS